MRLIVPGAVCRFASRVRSFSAARWRMMSVEWLRLKPGASSSSMLLRWRRGAEGGIRVKGLGGGGGKHEPSFLLVELVAHALGELLELTLGPRVVGVDHEILEVP